MDTDDKVQRSYPGRIEGKNGHLVLTKKKLLFLKEEGFLKKTFSVVLNLPYERVRDFSSKQKFNIEIVDASGGRNVFVSEVSASAIMEAFNSLTSIRKAAMPVS